MKKALKRHGSLVAITTDGLRSYKAALAELGCQEKQEISRRASNRVETAIYPTGDGSGHAQVPADDEPAEVRLCPRQRHNHFAHERHLVDRETYKSAARPRWPSGSRSWPEACFSKGRLSEVKTSCD